MKIKILKERSSQTLEKAFESWLLKLNWTDQLFKIHNVSYDVCPNTDGGSNLYMYSVCISYSD